MTHSRIDCSSTRCPSTPGDNPHCPACSHAAYYGEGRDAGGRTWPQALATGQAWEPDLSYLA